VRSGVTSPLPLQQLNLLGFLQHWLVSTIHHHSRYVYLRVSALPSCYDLLVEPCGPHCAVTFVVAECDRHDPAGTSWLAAGDGICNGHLQAFWDLKDRKTTACSSSQCLILFIVWYFSSYFCKQGFICNWCRWSRECKCGLVGLLLTTTFNALVPKPRSFRITPKWRCESSTYCPALVGHL